MQTLTVSLQIKEHPAALTADAGPNGRHEYFVPGQAGQRRRIWIVRGPSGPYLRAGSDSLDHNNLDTLPVCDRNPWEIANPDSEILAVHAALLPGSSGRVLMMGGDEHDKSNADSGQIHNTRIYDLAANTVLDSPSPPADVFCCGHAFLGDGKLFVGGGTEEWNDRVDPEADGPFSPEAAADHHFDAHGNPRDHWSGARECAIYETGEEDWTEAALMLPEPGQETRGGGRWYPTLLTLADGKILAVGGHPRINPANPDVNDGRHGSWLPEIYDPDTNSWQYADGLWIYATWSDISTDAELPAGQVRPDGENNYLYYPRMYVVPGGRVFMASPNNGRCGWYDPGTGLIGELQLDAPPHDGRGYAERNHTAVMLPLLPGDNYTPRFVFMGYEGAQRIELDLSDPDNPPVWQTAGERDWPEGAAPLRRHGCSVLLPTGEVFFNGGIDHDQNDEGNSPDGEFGLEGEIYNPGIDFDASVYEFDAYDLSMEGWTTTPRAGVVRNYHSVALLLPDGQVFTAGSNINGSSGGDNVKEYAIEIYSPWYEGDPGRPVIHDAPAAVTCGQEFQVVSPDAGRIQTVCLIRCGSVTHAWDGDQRYVGLVFRTGAPGVLLATAPPDGSIAPPAPYMIWLVDRQGRPCRMAAFTVLN